jgi:competence protein ComEC
LVNFLPLAKNKKQWLYIIIVLFGIFTINTFLEYQKFIKFKSDEIYITNAKVLNIYQKKYYQVLKLKTKNFIFFTSYKSLIKYKIHDNINLYINTQKVNFLEYIKGFYATSFNIRKLHNTHSAIQNISNKIQHQHQNKNITSLFNALFLAIPLNKALRDICSKFGVSHLVAISGFHLAILSFVIYWILYFPYSLIHTKYFPYRNKKFDILLITTVILFGYLILTNLVPSLLRSFIMFILGIYFLRSNIKVLSFGTLSLVTIIIIALFPKLLFSLSLWFSVAGVFYIFLFIKYFKNTNKIVVFFLFNIWIFLAINPIIHMFFGTLSLQQLYSPIFTIAFTIFYPVELFLHIIGQGDMLDQFILLWLNLDISSKNIITPTWVFFSYLIISLFAIPCPKWFRTLNLSFIAFNLWLYLQ